MIGQMFSNESNLAYNRELINKETISKKNKSLSLYIYIYLKKKLITR